VDEYTTFQFSLPTSILQRIEFIARKEGIPLEYFVARALASHLLFTEERARGNKVLIEDSSHGFRLVLEPVAPFQRTPR